MGPDHAGRILNFPGTPRTTEDPRVTRDSEPDTAASSAPDLLGEVDRIFELRSRDLGATGERRSDVDAERIRLQEEFASVCAFTVRPAMQSFLDRLRVNGGGGLLEERADVHGAGVAARIRLWMSLSGELIGRPRQDQHPYLQLDLDVVEQHVNLAEGDMWKGHGTSGPVGFWIAPEITTARVMQALIGVLRRAAS
jgi:hypothetical protein